MFSYRVHKVASPSATNFLKMGGRLRHFIPDVNHELALLNEIAPVADLAEPNDHRVCVELLALKTESNLSDAVER